MNRLGALFLVAAGLVVVPAAPAVAAPDCTEPGTQYAPVPWPQRMFNVERVWTLTRGANVRVAVLDSGVDANHPQLRGRVEPGGDFMTQGGDGRADCEGRGTQTAGIIAAQPIANVGFHGIAPNVTILPVRVSEDERGAQTSGSPGLAAGIRFAVSRGARVILVSPVFYAPNPDLAAAVATAVAADVVVVAAVGEDGASTGLNRTPFPASLPGVIGVAAIQESTVAVDNSGRGPFVDLVAPGAGVVTTQRQSGLVPVSGTAHAAAFVAGAAALVRSYWPNARAEEVQRRLAATAAPAPGGVDSAVYGNGVVSPYGALADQLTGDEPAPLPELAAPDPNRDRAWTSSGNLAKLLAGLGVLLALALVGAGAAFPRGRRRRWRPRIVKAPVHRPEDEEPQPPVRLFADREA